MTSNGKWYGIVLLRFVLFLRSLVNFNNMSLSCSVSRFSYLYSRVVSDSFTPRSHFEVTLPYVERLCLLSELNFHSI